MSPARQREAVEHVQQVCQVSQRRACRVLGVARTSARYKSCKDDTALIEALAKLRVEFPSWGYRKLTSVLRQRGWQVNPKRVYRIWSEHGWQRRRPKARSHKTKGDSANACHVRCAKYGNHVWAVDFVEDRTKTGQKLRILTVVDEYTREALKIEVRPKMGAKDVAQILNELIKERGAPELIRSDNGSEFTAKLLQDSLEQCGCENAWIAPASPWQNGKNERFNGILSQEVLSREVWGNRMEAQVIIEKWRKKYNEVRPHGSLSMMTPLAYAHKVKQLGHWKQY